MKKWIMPRGAGKTTQLILESAKTGATIVCCNNTTAKRLRLYASSLSIDINPPIDFPQFIIQYKGNNEKYLIDELDLCLKDFSVIGYTNT